MDNSRALAVRNELTPAVWQMIREIAPVMHTSHFFGVSNAEQATAIMLKGHDLGLSVTASFEFVQVIQGKPGLSPRGALAILHSSPEMVAIRITRIPEKGPFEGYECYMKRRNGFEYTARFTMADATKAGLIKSGSGWANYPEQMCQWRAVGFCADVVAPDLTAGMTSVMKMPEQMGVALTADGDVVEGQYAVVVPASVPPSPTSAPQTATTVATAISLDALLTQFSPDLIMAANNGQIPGTDAEVAAIARQLGVTG